MRDPFPIVCKIGDRLLEAETRNPGKGGWRDAKALVLLVAQQGDWRGAGTLADALGIAPDAQEAIYREAYGPEPTRLPIDREATREPLGERTA